MESAAESSGGSSTGIDTGRFRPMDIDATLTYVVGGTFAVMRGVLENRLGPEADITSAETLLIALGLDQTQAREVSRRELPSHDISAPRQRTASGQQKTPR